MRLSIKHQESYSRGELLLRTFFGFIYIYIPHGFLLFFVGLWSAILAFVSWWVILFTGKYPQSMFEFQVKNMAWSLRVSAREYNISDGYPAFGLNATDERIDLQIPYPERLSRGMLLVKTFFGFFYVILPHAFVLLFRVLWNAILTFVAWWVVLFTGKFPAYIHAFTVGTLRWGIRLNMYYGLWMTDKYPPFSGKQYAPEPTIPAETVQE